MALIGVSSRGAARLHGMQHTHRNPCISLRPRRHPGRSTQRRLYASRADGSSSSSSDDSEPVDIDQLAALLGQEAERMRQARDSDDEYTPAEPPADALDGGRESSGGGGGGGDAMLSPLGYASAAGEGDALAQVGDGGFYASEFELVQELGSISIQQVEQVDFFAGGSTGGGGCTATAAVIAYTATFYSGMPFQDPVLTLLKEYLPGARAVACNELQVLKHLAGMPGVDDKWRRAAAPLSQDPPIVELLGYFMAGPSPRAQQADPSLATSPEAQAQDTIWVVLRWDGMAPVQLYPASQQTSGLGLGRLFGGEAAAKRERARMLRAIAAGALRALAFVHGSGVVHGAIGSGSVLLSTFDDSSSMRLAVKLDNFGFARRIDAPAGFAAPGDDDTPLALGRRADLRQLAVVLLECFLSALAASGPSELTSAEAVQRLLGEVFAWDVEQYRRYCLDEPEWEAAAALLEEGGGAGWALLRDMVEGRRGAEDLLASQFCER